MDHSTTDVQPDPILGDTLTHAIDAYFANPCPETLRTFSARLIERCASAGTSYAVLMYERLDRLEARDE